MFDTPFFQVPRTTHATSEGPIELPILYEDASAVYAFFRADLGVAGSLLAGTGLKPALATPLHATAGVACFEYRSTSVGSYNEVGLALPVLREGDTAPLTGALDLLATLSAPEERRVGFHILHLPVTTAVANAAGRELWGYPKFVTDIGFHLDGRDLDCVVGDPGSDTPMLSLGGRMGRGVPTPGLGLLLFSHRDGELVRTTVNVRGGLRLRRGGTLRCEIRGEHPMAATAHKLGLDGASPVAVLTTTHLQSRLNAGAIVGQPQAVAG